MALTIGELTGRIKLDDAPFQQGVDQAEGRFRGLGSRLGVTGKAIGTAAGAAMGGALALGVAGNLQLGAATARMSAQLGATGPESARLGQVAGALYSHAYGQSMDEVTEAVRSVQQNIKSMAGASAGDLQGVTAHVMSLASAFGQDLGATTRAVDKMITTGLAPNANAALDMLTRGFQVGNDQAGDLLDTMNEYGTQFRKVGLDGTQAMGLIRQGLQGGARDADVVADAIKEFSIRAVDGSKLTGQGFSALGLDAQDMASKIAQGGPVAAQALDLTLDRLRAMPDPVKRSQAAVALFGTQAEDLGAALFSLDPSAAVGAMGQVGGAAAQMDQTLRDTAGRRVEEVKRTVQSWAMDLANLPGPLGTAGAAITTFGASFLTTVGPIWGAIAAQRAASATAKAAAVEQAAAGATQKASMLSTVATTLWGWLTMGAAATAGALRTAGAWLLASGVGAATYLAQLAVAVAGTVAGWAVMAAQATMGALRTAGAWLLASGTGMVTYLAGLAVAVAGTVAGWVTMGIQSMIQAARMAAAWFIALGPVGWVIAAVVGLVALIIANWSTVVSWTTTAWNAVVGAVSAAASWVANLAAQMVAWVLARIAMLAALPGRVGSFFGAMFATVSGWVSRLVGFVGTLPGRILSALSRLGSLLVGVGGDMVRGLWRGIQAGWSWLTGLVSGLAHRLLDAAKSALGIASPSKAFARDVGRWIPAGMARGIDQNVGPVTTSAANAARAALQGTRGLQVGTGAGAASVATLDDAAVRALAALIASRPARVELDGREVGRTVTRQQRTDRRLTSTRTATPSWAGA